MYNSKKEKDCPFCKIQFDIIAKNSLAIAFDDKYPIAKDHTLVVPLRHTPSFFDLDSHERNACLSLVDEMRHVVLKKDKTITGFNIGINDGVDAGQTVFHSHIHIIPRRKGDVANPRGGIRNIIPGKSGY
jgi:diadenosine tetraphosphate (Ap4A) HIT family hydrolase